MYALALALLAGCQPRNDPATMLADYNARLARLLDSPLPVIAPTRVPTWPLAADPVASAPAVRFDLFGFPDAGRCGLLQEVSAGSNDRAPTPPQRWLQEARLLRALGQCAQLTAGDLASGDVTRRAFAVAVHDALAQKREALPQLYWQGTLGAAGLREFFGVGALPLRTGDESLAIEAAAAIGWLAAQGRLQPEEPLPAGEQVDSRYYRLLGNRLGGRTWLSADLALRELARSTVLLEAAPVAQWCPGGQASAPATQLATLYASHYRQRLQPWLLATTRSSERLAGALEQLWQAQAITPPAEMARYRRMVWAAEPGSLVRDLDDALQRHERAWQALLAACGLPG